ncbi:MAG TPA: response regulator transcription factor [Terracidiphilus sp.]|jgi:two-component system KDP operon response regulator KdpE|nr:response regulator transcription factor [Terracidiphilus sp.]
MNENQSTVLIVDDEPSIRISLRTILKGLGFAVIEAARGEEAVSLVRTAHFDIVLLDINMPGLGGIEVCRAIRKITPQLPIVMLTVQGSEDRKVEALDSGADDYITKPFQLRELIARIRAAVRRNRIADEESTLIMIGDVQLDTSRHLVQKKGRRVHLTPKQFDLLHYLMANAGRPVPHARLLRTVWGPEYGNELEYLRTFVRQVRMKIEDDPANPIYLLTESHIGYRFSESI